MYLTRVQFVLFVFHGTFAFWGNSAVSGISSTEIRWTEYRHFYKHLSVKKNVRLSMTVKQSSRCGTTLRSLYAAVRVI